MRNHFSKGAITLTLLSAFFVAMTACTLRARNKGGEKDKKDLLDKTKIEATPNMDASDLADAGEQLVNPFTFMLADRTFSMALEKQADHKKALFYKAFLKRFMALKGILARLAPVVEKYGNIREYNFRIRKLPDSPLKKFLLDGKPDINDFYSAQTFLNEYVRAVNSFREFLLQNPEIDFTINLNPYVFQKEIAKQWGQSCHVIKAPVESIVVECNTKDMAVRKVNHADLMLLRQMTAAEVLGLSLHASYSLAGLEELSKIKKWEQLPYQTQLKVLKTHPEFATLRPDHVMNLISPLGQDFVAAVKWLETHQPELCPKGINSTEKQREGHIFVDGLCIDNSEGAVDARRILLAKIETALAGPLPLASLLTDAGPKYETLVDPFIIARRPIVDPKALLPRDLPLCNKKTHWPDPTIGGLLPRGDADGYFNFKACHQD